MTDLSKLSISALADEIGYARQVVKNAEKVFDALKGEAKRRGLSEAEGDAFGFSIKQEFVLLFDTVKLKEFFGERVSAFQKESFRETLRVVASSKIAKQEAA